MIIPRYGRQRFFTKWHRCEYERRRCQSEEQVCLHCSSQRERSQIEIRCGDPKLDVEGLSIQLGLHLAKLIRSRITSSPIYTILQLVYLGRGGFNCLDWLRISAISCLFFFDSHLDPFQFEQVLSLWLIGRISRSVAPERSCMLLPCMNSQ